MANKRYPNTANYYVYTWDGVILGPMTFKEATANWESAAVPCEILKVVINADGKQVK